MGPKTILKHPEESPDLLASALATLEADAVAPIDGDLWDAFVAAASPNSLRALASDWRAWGAWCKQRGLVSVPAAPEALAAWLNERAASGAAPASLGRYKASIARLHGLVGLADPTATPLVRLTLKAIAREKGTAQRQPLPLRFMGAVADVTSNEGRGVSIKAMLDACPDTPLGARDRALLSVAYDTGLRAAELVALVWSDIMPAQDPTAGLLKVRRTKTDQEGQGATAYLSPRSMRALAAWREVGGGEGAVFTRVWQRKFAARPGRPGKPWARTVDGELKVGKEPGGPDEAARVVWTVGGQRLCPGSLTTIYRNAATRAFEEGMFGEMLIEEFQLWLKGLSAHSTRVGLTQDLFTAGADIGGIMDSLRWKTPRMALAYNRNLRAEGGAAAKLLKQLE
jgi:integrase